MKTIKLEIELTYDDNIMHEDDPDAIKWFYKDILEKELTNEDCPNLILHSNEIGDEVGVVKVIKILK